MSRPKKSRFSDQPKPAAAIPVAPSPVRKYALLLFVVSILLYGNTLQHSYTQDDAIVITDNMFTTQGIKGIPGILKYDTFYGFFKVPGKDRLVAGGRYRPFSLITFAMEIQLFGQSPFVGHAVNILLFALTVVLFFYTALRLFPTDNYGTGAVYAALAAALLFAVHPIHTEAVANIKGRDEILALAGSLGALYLSLGALRTGRYSGHLAGALCLFFGLLSKENAITFLALIPLGLWVAGETQMSRVLRAMIPYLVAAGIFLFMRGAVVGWGSGEQPMEFMNNPYLKLESGRFVPFAGSEKLATVLFTLGKYVQLLVFPLILTHDYYPRHIDLMTFGNGWVWLSVLVYILLLVIGYVGLRKKKPYAVAIWFYLIPLSIVSNLVFPIGTHMAERLLFMPSVGFVLAVGWWLFPVQNGTVPGLSGRLVLLAAVALPLGIRTITRNQVWKDNFTLFTTDVRTSLNSAKLQNAVAGIQLDKSQELTDSTAKESMIREAIGHATKAVALHPFYANAYLLRGNGHYYLKKYEEAVQDYRQALAVSPGYQEALDNIPVALREAGRFAGEVRGDLPRAIALLKEADSAKSNDYETLRLLGIAHGMGGLHTDAIAYFTRAAALEPDIADAWQNLSTAYFASGDGAKGQEYQKKAEAIRANQ